MAFKKKDPLDSLYNRLHYIRRRDSRNDSPATFIDLTPGPLVNLQDMLSPGKHIRVVPAGAPFLIKYANRRYRFRLDFEFKKDTALKIDALFADSCYPQLLQVACDEEILTPKGSEDKEHPEGVAIVNCTKPDGKIANLADYSNPGTHCCALTQKHWFSIGELVLKRVNLTTVLTNRLIERDLLDPQGNFQLFKDDYLSISARSRTDLSLKVESQSPLTQPYGNYDEFPEGTKFRAYRARREDSQSARAGLLLKECRVRWSRREEAPLQMSWEQAQKRFGTVHERSFSQLESVPLEEVGRTFEIEVQVLKYRHFSHFSFKPIVWVGYAEELAKITLRSQARKYLEKIAESELIREIRSDNKDLKDLFRDPVLTNAIKTHELDRLSFLTGFLEEDDRRLVNLTKLFDKALLEGEKEKREEFLRDYLAQRENLINKRYLQIDLGEEVAKEYIKLTRPGSFSVDDLVEKLLSRLGEADKRLKDKLSGAFSRGSEEATKGAVEALSFLAIEGTIPENFIEKIPENLLPLGRELQGRMTAYQNFKDFYTKLLESQRSTETKIKEALIKTTAIWDAEKRKIEVDLRDTETRRLLLQRSFENISQSGARVAEVVINTLECPASLLRAEFRSKLSKLEEPVLEASFLESFSILGDLAMNCSLDFVRELGEKAKESLSNVKKALEIWKEEREPLENRPSPRLREKMSTLSEEARKIYEKILKEKQIFNCSLRSELKSRYQERLSWIVRETTSEEVDKAVELDAELQRIRNLMKKHECRLEEVELQEWPETIKETAEPLNITKIEKPARKLKGEFRPRIARPPRERREPAKISRATGEAKKDSAGFASLKVSLLLLLIMLFALTTEANSAPCQLTGSAQASKNIVCSPGQNCTDQISGTIVLKGGMKACMILNEDFYTFEVTRARFPLVLSNTRKCYPPRNLANKGVLDVGPGRLVPRDWEVACEIVSCHPKARQEFGQKAWYYRGFFGVQKLDYVLTSTIEFGEPILDINVKRNGVKISNYSNRMNWVASTSIRPSLNGHHLSFHNFERTYYYHADPYGSGRNDYCSIRQTSGADESKLEFVNPPPTTLVCGHFTERDKTCLAPVLGENPGKKLPYSNAQGELREDFFSILNPTVTLTWQSQSDSYKGQYDSGCLIRKPKVELYPGNCQRHNVLIAEADCPVEVMSNCSIYKREGGSGYVIPISSLASVCEVLLSNPSSSIKRHVNVPAITCEDLRSSTTTVKTAKEIFGHDEEKENAFVQVVSTVGQTGLHVVRSIPEVVNGGSSAVRHLALFLRIGLPLLLVGGLCAGGIFVLKRFGFMARLLSRLKKKPTAMQIEPPKNPLSNAPPGGPGQELGKLSTEEVVTRKIHRLPSKSVFAEYQEAEVDNLSIPEKKPSNISFNAEMLSRGLSFRSALFGRSRGVKQEKAPI